jgi:hypothetical protein
MTGAQIIPFATSAEQAWDSYMALVAEARADPRLLLDAEHRERRAQAHRTFSALFCRECEQIDRARERRA